MIVTLDDGAVRQYDAPVNPKKIAADISSSIAKKEDRIFETTYGFLILIKKIGTLTDKLFGYSFCIRLAF